MMVYLSKLLPLLVYPIGVVFLILAAILFINNNRIRTYLIILCMAILWIGGNRWVAFSLVRSLEWQYLPMDAYPTADAIVVLGGGTDSLDYPRKTTEINGAGDRIIYALDLYRQGKAPRVVLSGGNITWYENRATTPAQEMSELWVFMKGPSDILILQDASMNTSEDASFSSSLLEQKGFQRIILVTSAIHMPRAVALFQRHGLEVIPAPTDYTVTRTNWNGLKNVDIYTALIYLIPNNSNLSLMTAALKEYFGLFTYRLLGWL